ncbi:MAG: dihydropteroate synthase-like protein, partial [Methanobacterium sp.]
MKVLIVTAKLASSLVKMESTKSEHDVHVHVVNTPIAAFLTPKRIVEELEKYDINRRTQEDSDVKFNDFDKKFDLKSFEIIITPGLIRKDVSYVKQKTGIETYKGPKDAADLAIVLEMIEKLDLSPTMPADKLIEEELRKRALMF